MHFDIDPFLKHCLLNGLDDIGLTLEHADDISSLREDAARTSTPVAERLAAASLIPTPRHRHNSEGVIGLASATRGSVSVEHGWAPLAIL